MDSYKSFTDRIHPITPTILGLKLVPYNLGHAILLKKAKSVFIVGGWEKCNGLQIINEMVFALLVCNTTYDNFMAEVQSGEITSLIKEYTAAIRKGISDSKLSSVKEVADSIGNELELFINYLKNGMDTPKFKPVAKAGTESDFRPNPIEFEQSLFSTLMTECNYTRVEALNTSLTETLSAYCLFAHKRDVIELVSKEEFQLKQILKEQNVQS